MRRKWVKGLTVLALIIGVLSFYQVKAVQAAEKGVSLNELEPYDTEGIFYENEWRFANGGERIFENMSGSPVVEGIGMTTDSSYGGISSASFNVAQMNYKNFTATVSLDKKWVLGDYGKTAVAFYADDVKLFEKQLTANDGMAAVNVKLPEKIKNFHVIVTQKNGSKGTANVIIYNTSFSTEGSYLHSNELPVSPAIIGASDSSGLYNGKWGSSGPFQNIRGDLITDGMGFYSNDSTSYAVYNIDSMGINQFESQISLDSKWTSGDYGRTVIGLYADDYLIYEKEFTVKTPVQNVKINLPKGIKNMYVIVKQKEGARGTHGLVLANPLFSKNGKAITVPKTVAFSTVGAIDSENLYKNGWGDKPFQLSNSQIVTEGIALTSDYWDSGFAEYDIKNMGFNSLKTSISLDASTLVGDYGNSSVYIYAGKTLLYSTTLQKKDIKTLTLKIPNGTSKVKILVKQKQGAKGYQLVVFKNPVFTVLPVSSKISASTVSIANNKGRADAITVRTIAKNDIIKVYSGSKLIATGKASSTSLRLNIKQLGTKKGTIYITKTSPGKLESDRSAVNYKGE